MGSPIEREEFDPGYQLLAARIVRELFLSSEQRPLRGGFGYLGGDRGVIKHEAF
jgi:hypothetical protein